MPKPVKTIAIVGATGLVGSKLYSLLDKKRYKIYVVGRSSDKLKQMFPDAKGHMDWQDFESSDSGILDSIVNLAGSNVSAQKWDEDYKKSMLDSRITSTLMCVEKCAMNPNIHLINASAVSAYGFYSEPYIRFTERNLSERKGNSFLQDLIDQWESTALKAAALGNTVTLLRTGVVLDLSEGALPAMKKPFEYYLGGTIGHGRQMMSWVSTLDIARIIEFLLEQPDIRGPVNCVAPIACDNRTFAKSLGKAMGKPSTIPTPAWVIKLAMGQMGEELLIKGQHVYPEKLLNAGFHFQDPTIESYFNSMQIC